MNVQPYLCFEGRCEEAINFYKEALGAEVVYKMRFKDSPDPEHCANIPPGAENKIMHAELRIGGAVIMMSDGMCKGPAKFDGVSMSLVDLNEAEAERYFAALSEGGQVRMPMTETFFAKRFGMVTDKFGVCWMPLGGAKDEEESAGKLAEGTA